MKKNKVYIKLLGILIALAGAVIIVHTVPVFAWYFVLIGLILALGFIVIFM